MLNAGATSTLLKKVTETNDLRKGDLLIQKQNTNLVKSVSGMYARNSSKLHGIFDIVKLKKRL